MRILPPPSKVVKKLTVNFFSLREKKVFEPVKISRKQIDFFKNEATARRMKLWLEKRGYGSKNVAIVRNTEIRL